MAQHDSTKVAFEKINLLRYRSECARAVTCHAIANARLALEHAREVLAEARLRRMLLLRRGVQPPVDADLN